MKKLLLALLLTITPAQAQWVNDGFHEVFVKHQDGTKDICLMKLENAAPGNTAVPFIQSGADRVHTNYDIQAGSLVYTAPKPPPVDTTMQAVNALLSTRAADPLVTDAQYAKAMRISRMPMQADRDAAWATLAPTIAAPL